MLKGEIINSSSIVSGGKAFLQNTKLPKDALKSVLYYCCRYFK